MRTARARAARGAQAPAARGFTLVELMVVVVVLGIVMLFAAPSFSRTLGNRHVTGAAEEAYADLQFARSEAVQRNRAVRVTFASAGYAITVIGSGETLKTVNLSQSTLAAGNGTVVDFSPTRATAAVTGTAPRFAHGSTSATLQVSVNALGRAEICSPSATMRGYTAC